MSPLDLPPDLRSRLARVSLAPLAAATVAGGGVHPSRNRGAGLEFAQYRGYERGDDLRRIDWKLYARSDRLFVRDAERESPVAAWLILDASASMAQADLARPHWSRFDAARRLTAAVMEIAIRDGDRIGLVVERGEDAISIPLGAGARQLDRLRSTLIALSPGGTANWARALEVMGERTRAGHIVLIVSDGFDEACATAAERMSAAGRDVAFIRLLTADERDFAFTEGYRFRDPESGEALIGDGPAMRRDFLLRFGQARTEQARRLRSGGIRYVEHFTDEDADQPLRTLMRQGTSP